MARQLLPSELFLLGFSSGAGSAPHNLAAVPSWYCCMQQAKGPCGLGRVEALGPESCLTRWETRPSKKVIARRRWGGWGPGVIHHSL